MRPLALLVALVLVGDAAAARIETLEVGHRRGDFTLRVVMLLEASPAAVKAALTDFEHLPRLSPAIVESRVLSVAPDGAVVQTKSRACAGWFCRELRKTERVVVGAHEIVATVLPEQSNLVHGVTRWHLTAVEGRTRVDWDSTMDPAFFVPPLIGPRIVKGALKREGEALAVGLERAAQALDRAAGR